MTCIILALQHDLHADAVVAQFSDRDNFIRVDPYEPISSLKHDVSSGTFNLNDRTISFDQITGIYCRVALESLNNTHLDPVSKFSFCESIAALSGILLTVDERLWINSPWCESKADLKAYALRKAQQIGFNVPQFWIISGTNLRHFKHKKIQPLIIKPISDTSIALQDGSFTDVPDHKAFDAPYTTNFEPDAVDFNLIDNTPVMLQIKVNPSLNIRICMLDGQCFATAFEHLSQATDSRLHKCRHEMPWSAPTSLQTHLRSLMASFGLRMATFDLVQDTNGVMWLLDINPSGNWLWQELLHKLPISKALANSLSRKPPGLQNSIEK